ncbi:hypothetical protein [Vibrio sagamiensis]|uniref:Uncharacterized protein n=1 Tax=Vibrio sagamiensis NBRC 104589 TaxID=1219064 RepID=A0A511QEX3_9VIBR|nr:hypothetical protein [Vibrio sagamiensis]PNQ56123.1 hypothetical protein C1141_14040 [Vibrio agarivorans]GEM75843.1 hypothetical protein VSA01S_19550 [Vibrio sagamiensis NBRC 104589]
MKPLLLTTLLFSLSNPFSVTATEPSLKFYRANEIINTKSINIYIALVETITKETTPDIFRFNDIHVKKINESTWEIANNTPIPSTFFPVKVSQSPGLELIVSNLEIPAFSSATVTFDKFPVDNPEFVYQGNIFLPRVNLGPYNEEDCNAPQDLSETCYSYPDLEQKETIKNMIAITHKLSNTRQYSELIEQFMIDRCTNQPSRCSNYNDIQLPYGIRNLLAFGGQDHNLALKVMRNRYRSEGVGAGRSVKLNQYLTNTRGWAASWHSILNPDNAYSERFYRTWFHEIAHAHGFSHTSGMTYGFADYFAKYIIPLMTTEEERKTITPYNPPEVLLDYRMEATTGAQQNKVFIHFLGADSTQTEVDFQVITACEWEKEINNIGGEITLKYDTVPNCPVFIRASEVTSNEFATIKIPRHDFAESSSYVIDNKKFTILNSLLLNEEDNGWGIRNQCHLPNTHLATQEEYQVLWGYLSEADLLNTLERQYFLSSDGPRSSFIWQLNFLPTKMDSKRYRIKNKLGTKHGLVCVSER